MHSILKNESSLMQTLSKIAWMIWYGCLWLICSLPVVTIGASTAALYTVAFAMGEDGSYTTKAFFKAFGENLKKGTALWGILLLLAGILAAAYYGVVLVEDETIRVALLVPFCFLFVLWMFGILYVFPLTAFFENTVGNTVKNAVAMGIKHLRQSIYCFALIMIPLLVLLVSQYWFLRLLYLWICIYPGVASYIIARILRPVFLLYAPQTGEPEESEPDPEEE